MSAAGHRKDPKGDLPTDGALAYRINEAAKATGLSRRTLYNRAREGKLTMRKDGNITIITRAELERYLNSIPPVTFDAH